MATLESLIKSGHLLKVQVNLARREFPDRQFCAFPSFMGWLKGPVMRSSAFYDDDVRPALQAQSILRHFISGQPMIGSRLFQKMSPLSDHVWEMRTADLRFFGWFPQVDCFIATSGDLFENLKSDPSLYEKHRIAAAADRAGLDLDEPKSLVGVRGTDVVSE